MSTTTPQVRTLQRAVEDCGGEAELAKVLGVSVEVLSRWLSGLDALPTATYVRALDLVAAGR
jgi:transcriptional regulator with XRE-family HTH domain